MAEVQDLSRNGRLVGSGLGTRALHFCLHVLGQSKSQFSPEPRGWEVCSESSTRTGKSHGKVPRMSFIFPPVCLIAEGDSTGHGYLSFEPSFLLCLAFGIMRVDSPVFILGSFLTQ